MPPIRLRPLLLAVLLALSFVVIPAGTATAAAEPVHGLKGEYYKMSQVGARDFGTLGGTLLDANIDLPGLVGAFTALTGQGEHTTGRWTGRLTAPATGDYTFFLRGDDGFRMFLDGQPVVDYWEVSRGAEIASRPITLTAGQAHDVRVEMFQDYGGADLFLSWTGPGIAKQIVPESAFTVPDGFQDYPARVTVQPNGRRLTIDLDQPITDVAQTAAHLVVEADTTPLPISSVTATGKRLVLTLGAPVQKGQRVRLNYDGHGGLTAGGEPVPLVSRIATNTSTHRLTTPWGDQVDPKQPLPEYPRPQLVRDRWLNLNGPWEFAGAGAGEQPVFGRALGERITVPFPVESLLSGVERREQHMFYRKLVTVPRGWQAGSKNRLKLNFGAVDHQAKVWVNGTLVTEHTGGYSAFTADITDALRGTGPQEILVAVTDTTGPDQPIGKQSLNPGGIVYTPTSGIWQTVWLEPVAPAAIDELVTTPSLDSLTVRARSSQTTRITATAYDKAGRKVGAVTGDTNTALHMPIRDPHLWSPDDPYLYDLRVKTADDTVTSYFGLRTVEVKPVGGFPKLVLNGKPIFSLATLDQGFWPDGLYTAPSDDALRWDVEQTKKLGFNAIRKHIKVEPARWYRHADELGVLVWQDFVSATIRTTAGQQAWRTEADRAMSQTHNSPAVIGYVVFNEGWGEWDRAETGRIAEQVKAADPTRIVNAHSGVNCCDSKGDSGKGDVIDHHDYLNETPPFPDATRMAMDGEHGGFTLRTPGHMWPGAPANIYSGVADKDALTAKYVDNTTRFYLEAAGAELSGSVYTQITDLETELNGLWTYDRRQIKVNTAAVRAINRKVVKAGTAPAGATYPGRGDWKLDEGQGTTAKDSSGNKSDMSFSGGPRWVTGVDGTALAFDGDDSADTAAPVVDTTKDYSIAAWVTLDELPGNYASAVSQDGRVTESPFYLQYGQGAFAFSTPGGNRARLPVTPELNRWYHLVGVRDHGTGRVRLYVDGRLAGDAAAGPDVVSTGPLTIGRAKYAGNRTDYWSGSIDEVHAYDRALTDAEVAALHSEEAPG
ncbi:LamG-like jellyroll fold domain-containing protein [Actinoplanes sp. NPDC089786]|uniref:LamG-like jellyroll fold domain-containing protein n=1 Tax=Actinoplanes sp. NPDC089786 TaxID=3155185 RepID=UPI003428B097